MNRLASLAAIAMLVALGLCACHTQAGVGPLSADAKETNITMQERERESPMAYQFLLTGPSTPTWSPPTTTTVTATSASPESPAANVCNNAGMTGTRYPQDRHNSKGGDMWLSSGADPDPALTIDLGAVYPLGKILVWNYNRLADGRSYSGRGIRHCSITYSTDGANWTALHGQQNPPGRFELAQAPPSGEPLSATNLATGPNEPIEFLGVPARFVRIAAHSNWGGAPNDGDKTYFGLSAVRIYRYRSAVAHAGDFIAAKPLKWSSAKTSPENTTSNLGMSDAGSGAYTPDASARAAIGWQADLDDRAPYIIYDLGGTYPLGEMALWSGVSSKSGVESARIYYSVTMPGYNPEKGFADWTLLPGPNPDQSWAFGPAAGNIKGSPFRFADALARFVLIAFNPNPNGGSCGLSQARFFASSGLVAEPLPHWTGLLGQRSEEGSPPVWSGGDCAWSVGYPGHGGKPQSLFGFLDALRDNWNPRTYGRIGDMNMTASNFMIYRGGKTLTPAISDTAFLPTTTLVSDPSRPALHCWTSSAVYIAEPTPTIYVLAAEVDYTDAPDIKQAGRTLWGLPVVDGVVQFSGPGVTQDATGLFQLEPVADTIHCGYSILDGALFGDPYLYIYGLRGDPRVVVGGMRAIVARVRPADIRNVKAWEFYAGSEGWVGAAQGRDFRDSAPISAPGSAGAVAMAIAPAHRGQFMMVAAQNIIGAAAVSYAPHPWGPFDDWQQVYCPLEEPYPAMAYALQLHPEISDPGEMIFSTIPFMWVPAAEQNADISHARFVRMRTIR